MKMICPAAKKCSAIACIERTPHEPDGICKMIKPCPSCVPVKAKRKGKK